MDWTDTDTMRAVQSVTGGDEANNSPAASKNGAGGRIGVMGILQGVGVVAMLVIALGWFFWPSGSDETNPEEMEGEVAYAASLEEAVDDGDMFVPTPTPIPTLEAELLSDVVGSGAKVKDLVVPRTLEIKGVSFIVQPVTIKVGDWPPPDIERAVSWVYGTVINYVMGLNGTASNKELLASLQPGDQLLLRMSTGDAYRFVYADTVKVSPQASEVFRQNNRPGLTLVLLGDETSETRVVIRGVYVPDTELKLDPQAPVKPALPGKRVVLDDKIQLTYLDRKVVPAPETLGGYAYLGVNYVIEYVGGGDLPLLTASFIHHVEFDGLLYPMVSVEEAAAYPALPETLLPDLPYTTTVVYAVPKDILRQEIVWEFSADPANGGTKARAVLPPYEGLLNPGVEVKEYKMENGTIVFVLNVTAALHNVTLNIEDIQVHGGTLSPTGNIFPWRVPAGQSDEFVLMLRPDGEEKKVGVIVLDQGIEQYQ
ncbi:MAG: hypothetical protein GY796_15835 [Chloroflexi bacterium]|nr:hypothetical protein [Chloroflexota bacterium]